MLVIHGMSHAELWKDYLHAMQVYTGMASHDAVHPKSQITDYPQIIEGAQNLQIIKQDFLIGSLNALDQLIGIFHINIFQPITFFLYSLGILSIF